jgi:ABC-type multidrug transport system fused ATPase/permease subunit
LPVFFRFVSHYRFFSLDPLTRCFCTKKIYCWTYFGERLTQKFREKYVSAVLAQEIGWFDARGAKELPTRVTELCGKIQDGMGRKLGDAIQFVGQIIGCYATAFYLSWRLAVVLIAAVPVVAGIGKLPLQCAGTTSTD